MIKILRFIAPLVLVANFAFAAFCEARSLDEIKKSGFIRIGFLDADSSTLGWRDANGSYVDYDLYLGERIAKDLGVRLERVFINMSKRVPYVREGVVDIMLANFTVTEERARSVVFALPYMKVAISAISPASSPIASEADLVGKRIIAIKDSAEQEYLETHDVEDMKIIVHDDYKHAFAALKNGEADGFLCDNAVAIKWASENPNFVAKTMDLGPVDTIAPAVQRGNFSLMDWLNDEIIRLGEEDFLLEAYEKTLRPKFGENANPNDVIVEDGVVR